jgi:tetratricopeptide (TPR) repeat protein
MTIDEAFKLATEHYEAENFQQAEQICREILEKQPNNAETLYFLGIIYIQLQQSDSAIHYIQRSLQINSTNANTYLALGTAFQQKGLLDEAVSCYQKTINLDPSNADSFNLVGNIFKDKGRLDEATNCYQKALQLNPNSADIYNELGILFHLKKQYDRAIIYYKKAIQLNSKFALAYCNIAKALHQMGQIEEAIIYFKKTLMLEPNLSDAHLNMSLSFLLLGDFQQGWKEYEWRKKLTNIYNRDLPQPLWNGSDIAGLTILLHAEQGFGDTIQFIRYAPLVAQRGARVIVECMKELRALIRNVEGIDNIFTRGEQLPIFDMHCPLPSLPLIFNTNIESIPANIPYIIANNILVERWREKFDNDKSKLKIGLTWLGNPNHVNDETRSCSPKIFLPFVGLSNITFYSLQKNMSTESIENLPKGIKLVDYTSEIKDFSDTAAIIENLDLVISVDTSVAHLAGALGKPVWTLIPFVPDWRWMLNRADNPWYPTMRLLRQPSSGDWESVIAKVKDELLKLMSNN